MRRGGKWGKRIDLSEVERRIEVWYKEDMLCTE